MARNKDTVATFGSVLIGILTFALLGISLSNVLDNILTADLSGFTYIFVGAGALIGLFLGFRFPIFTEATSFGIAVLILLQGIWDIANNDFTSFSLDDSRIFMTVSSLVLFTLNLFTGKLRVNTAKRVVRKQLGVS